MLGVLLLLSGRPNRFWLNPIAKNDRVKITLTIIKGMYILLGFSYIYNPFTGDVLSEVNGKVGWYSVYGNQPRPSRQSGSLDRIMPVGNDSTVTETREMMSTSNRLRRGMVNGCACDFCYTSDC